MSIAAVAAIFTRSARTALRLLFWPCNFLDRSAETLRIRGDRAPSAAPCTRGELDHTIAMSVTATLHAQLAPRISRNFPKCADDLAMP